MDNILKFDDFSLNEKRRIPKSNNLDEVERIPSGVKYKNEIFPGINIPKRYVGKGKFKFRVLAKEGTKVKPVNFGDRDQKVQTQISRLKKKYWESLPTYK